MSKETKLKRSAENTSPESSFEDHNDKKSKEDINKSLEIIQEQDNLEMDETINIEMANDDARNRVVEDSNDWDLIIIGVEQTYLENPKKLKILLDNSFKEIKIKKQKLQLIII